MEKYSVERYLSIRSAGEPSFSPDGKKIAFSTNITGVPQLWEVDANGGWPQQLVFAQERTTGAYYSPKDNTIAFSMDLGGNERQQIWLVKNEGAETICLTNDPKSIHTFGGWHPQGTKIAYVANRRDPAIFDVYIQDVCDGEPEMIYESDGSTAVAAWSADGNSLVILKSKSNWNQRLYLLCLKTGRLEALTPHEGMAAFKSVVWHPHKNGFYFVTDLDREFTALAYYDCDRKSYNILENPPWDIEEVTVSPTGTLLAYTVNKEGYSDLHIKDLQANKELTMGCLPKGVIVQMAFSPDGKKLAFTFTGPQYNANVWVYDIAVGSAKQITRADTAGIPKCSFSQPKAIRYQSFDGLEIPAFFSLPPGAKADGSLPVVVDVHGGPESQKRPILNPVAEFFLNRGYAVLGTNVRGSTGYGRTYSQLDNVEKRMDSVADLKYAVEWLHQCGYVNPNKIAVMGASYGGFMVLSALTTYPDLWAAGVDLVGIANFITFLENTGPWRRKNRAAEYGDPVKDRDFLIKISPINHVDKIIAPLLVIHGLNDPRVPIGEAEQIVVSLRERDSEVDYLVFDDEGHGVVKLKNRIIAYKAIADFLDRHLK